MDIQEQEDDLAAAQLNLLLQVLQATAYSNTNPEVVYTLLQAHLSLVNENFSSLLYHWAVTTFQQVDLQQSLQIAAVLGDFSTLIQQFSLGNVANNLEIAIAGYEAITTVFTHEAFPQEWLILQNEMGLAYTNRILGVRAENLEGAIQNFLAALEVCNREAYPELWANLHNNLGNAYLYRANGEREENLEAAIICFLKALEVRNYSTFPRQWATLQVNLGNAYLYRIVGERVENVEAAICFYASGLEIYTRIAYPEQWSGIQNNLGKAYCNRLMGERPENLEAAIRYYQAALEVRTQIAMPYVWAETQQNLADAYSERIWGNRSDNLEQAIECYLSVLQVYTHQLYPRQWADVQAALGNAFNERIRGNRAENLECSIQHHCHALEFYTREANPQQWARIQNNLGNSYRERIQGEKAENIEVAISCYLSALEIRTSEDLPELWASTQNNLGNAYRERIRGESVNNLFSSITCFESALNVHTRQSSPEMWSQIQHNLGATYLSLVTEARTYQIREGQAELLEMSIHCFLDALEVRTYEKLPVFWAQSQSMLGTAYLHRIQGDRAENLEAAIAYLLTTLEVYTRQDFSENWAENQTNLGSAYHFRIHGEKVENLKLAIHYYSSALEVLTPFAFPRKSCLTQQNLGLNYAAIGDYKSAYTTLATAIETIESLRTEIVVGSGIDEDKQKLIEEWLGIYVGMVSVCVELGNFTEAITYVERSKARNLVELLATRELYPKGNVSEAVVDRLRQLRQEIDAEQRRLTLEAQNFAVSRSEGNVIPLPLQDTTYLHHLQQQRNTLIQEEIQPHDPGFSLTKDVHLISVNQIQHLLPNDQSALIEWYLLDQEILAFIVSRQNSTPIVWRSSSADRQALEKWLDEYQIAYHNNKQNWQMELSSYLHQLSEILHLDELLLLLPQNSNQVILIPHRYLHICPLHALPLSDGSCFLDRFNQGVRYAPSCQLLQISQKHDHHQLQNLFAVQNPTNDLPYADIEVAAIRPFFAESQIFPKQAGTKASLMDRENLATVHCFHLSCHGFFNLQSPLESSLFLANGERLTLGEIFALTLNQCRLVTLSACESGLTDFTSLSDEYIGLPSGFIYAGSPNVVSSLWKVDDISTAMLMIRFYQNLKAGSTVAIALNTAQIWLRDSTQSQLLVWSQKLPFAEVLKQEIKESLDWFDADEQPFAQPHYWAAFCAVGC
jgi:CHAT domain-containing protein